MKKLEKEQLPKVVALGVMSTLVLGYAAFSLLGHSSGQAAPANASPAHASAPAASAGPGSPNGGATAAAPGTGAAAPASPLLAMAPIDHEDPFVPVIVPQSAPAPKPAAPKPAAAKPSPASHPGGRQPMTKLASLPDAAAGPAMDGDPGVIPFQPPGLASPPKPNPAAKPNPAPKPAAAKPVPKKPAAPVLPPAPAVVVTGILQGQDNVAILRWSDTKRQVVRQNDLLEGGYRVREIRPDAVVLVRGAYQWVVSMGSSHPAAAQPIGRG
jgi:hypothetical protein